MAATIDKVTTSGTFSLDGGTWDGTDMFGKSAILEDNRYACGI
jgi:hypothetical protein